MDIDKIKQFMEEAECILIGCGRELSDYIEINKESIIFKPLEKYKIFNQEDLVAYVHNEKYANWLQDILIKNYNKTIQKEKNIYQKLFHIIKEKNYFIVTTNTEERIYQSDIEEARIVSPCGNEGFFQCKCNCTQEVWRSDQYIESILSNLEFLLDAIKAEKFELLEQYFTKCKSCQKEAIFNVRQDKLQYNEQGYLKQWKVYIDWLQKTLNKKLLLIELGEDFGNPTVIRWPFEKTAFINNKAILLRVNESFPQISEEIKDRAFAIKMNSANFLEIFDKKQNRIEY